MLLDLWQALMDNHTCAACAALHGRTWSPAEPHPTPPEHPHCRCSILTLELPDTLPDPGGPRPHWWPPMWPWPPPGPDDPRPTWWPPLWLWPPNIWIILPPKKPPPDPTEPRPVKGSTRMPPPTAPDHAGAQPLHLQTALDLAPTPTPRRYAATLLAAGTLQGWDIDLPAAVLSKATPLFADKTALLDHPDLSHAPRVDRILGYYEHVQFSGDRVTGELVLSPTPLAQMYQPLLDQAAAGQPGPDVGLSANLWLHLDEAGHTITEIVDVETVDIVFRPASKAARLERILASQQPTPKTWAPETQEQPTMADKPTTPAPAPVAPPAPLAAQAPTAPPAPPAPEVPAGVDPLSQYRARFADATLELSLQSSGLPPASMQWIRAQLSGQTPTVEVIDAKIAEQRAFLGQIAQETTIFGFGNPLDRGKRVMGMTAPLDEAAEIVNWMFGVRGAKLPEPSMRQPAQVYRALTGDLNWYGRFNPEHVMFASATTTSLADLAVNALNKVVIDMWTGLAAYRWFEQLVTVQPNDGSLQEMKWIAFGGIGTLPTVSEGAAYTELTPADTQEHASFTKYGGYIGITEEMLRMSQLAKIQAVPKALAIAAVRTRSAAIASIFTTASGVGPTLHDDAQVLFYSTHGSNVQTTALSAAAWKAARIECFKMTEAGSSKRLGFYPKYCLIPADLFDDSLVYFGYGSGPGGYPGTANNDTNPYGVGRDPSDPRPIPVVVPEWTDTADWAYLVDPNLQPVLQMSYAQNPGGGHHPEPELYSVASPTAGLVFTNDVLPVKVRDWFAYGVATWRGIGKRNV